MERLSTLLRSRYSILTHPSPTSICIFQVFLIFYCMVQTGDDGSGTQSFMDKIEGSNSYAALLWATMGVSVFMIIYYAIQITKDGSIIVPNARAIREVLTAPNTKKDDLEPRARSLMSLKDSSESFLLGMEQYV